MTSAQPFISNLSEPTLFGDLWAREGRTCRRNAMRADLPAQFLAENAVVATIREIQDQSHGQPGKETPPVRCRQGKHQQEAGSDAEDGHHGHKGTPERPLCLWINAAHD